MRCFYLLILGFLFSCQLKTTKHLSFSSHTTYVGTYTNGESKGIYKLDLLDDGSLTNLKLLAETENPSFLAKSMEGTYLVAVNETSDKNNKGSLESYKILEDSLMLIKQKKQWRCTSMSCEYKFGKLCSSFKLYSWKYSFAQAGRARKVIGVRFKTALWTRNRYSETKRATCTLLLLLPAQASNNISRLRHQ
jgi:hypothetical protein